MSKVTQLVSGGTGTGTRSPDSCSKVLSPYYNLSLKKKILKTLILKHKEAVNWLY